MMDSESEVRPPNSPPTSPVPPAKNERTLAMVCHLLGLCWFVLPMVGNIVGPLVLWLIKKDESALVDDQGKEAVNFQITVTLALLVSSALMLVIVGIFLFFAVLVADVVLVIMAMLKANEGQRYRYPVCLRFLK
jgi:uncharacterized protein